MPEAFDNCINQIDQAMIVHLQWRSRLNNVFKTGEAAISVEEASNDCLCDFGKWLTGQDISDVFRSTERYIAVHRLHYDFHKSAAVVLDLALKRDNADKAVLRTAIREYNQASNKLLRELLDWKEAEVEVIAELKSAMQ
ncbi:MAG: CZB domain-containing protein [Rhodospirillaceae bacterium]